MRELRERENALNCLLEASPVVHSGSLLPKRVATAAAVRLQGTCSSFKGGIFGTYFAFIATRCYEYLFYVPSVPLHA